MDQYHVGFSDGMAKAERMLREAANSHKEKAGSSKKVLESQAHELATALLSGWANAIEIRRNAALAQAETK